MPVIVFLSPAIKNHSIQFKDMLKNPWLNLFQFKNGQNQFFGNNFFIFRIQYKRSCGQAKKLKQKGCFLSRGF